MKKTVTKSNVTVNGSNGNDQFTVKGSGNTINAKGGAKDTIQIAAGDRHTINGGNGVDVITVKKGNYHTIKGENGNDKITLSNIGWNGSSWNTWGDKDLTYGGAGNDTIDVKAGRHEVHGDAGNDTITIYKNAQENNVVYGEAGNDNITVKGSNYHTIYAGSSSKKGADTITIAGGTKTTVYGEEGVDKITVSGGREHVLYGGAGKDQILIGKKIGGTQVNNVVVYGEEDADAITVNVGDSHEINTGAGKDIVTINSGSGHIIRNKIDQWNDGFGGNDVIKINKKAGNGISVVGINSSSETVKVYGGNNHTISLGDGEKQNILIAGGKNHNITTGNDKDIITVQNKAHVSRILTNGGKDEITIKSGAYVNNNNNGYWNMSIETGEDDDKITIEKDAGNNICFKTENGNDKIYIKGGNNHTAYTGDGIDTIVVTGGSGHEIHLESGQNNVTLSAKNITLNMNANADDSITLNWGTNRGLYTIYATKNNSIATVDTLTITNAKMDDFTFSCNDSYWHRNLLLTNTDGSKILIDYWADGDNKTSFDGIKFADGTLSFDDINKKAGWA